jgi:hypothetical protein
MSPLNRSLALAVINALVLSSLSAIWLVERAVWPRVWVRTVLADPKSPPRGRYVRFLIEVEAGRELLGLDVVLSAQTGRLVAMPATIPTGIRLGAGRTDWVGGIFVTTLQVDPPLSVFLPAQLAAQWPRPADEEIWVEVTVPARGSPRPIRVGVKKSGVLTGF